MFEHEGKTYDCPYCHNDNGPDGLSGCHWGSIQGSEAIKELDLEGAKITVDYSQEIKPGDTYIAQRNTGLKLLTCEYVHSNHWIAPKENAYAYDTWECGKVISIS